MIPSTKSIIALLFCLLFGLVPVAIAQVEAPELINAKFDSEGKLQVRTSFSAIEGCYLTVNGGLSRSNVDTGIISIQLRASQAAKGIVSIKTKKRYYCSKRKLFVNVELVCLNSIIGSALSDTISVSVPSANQRK